MPSLHAKFSPSSMKRVLACPASYAYEHGKGAEHDEDDGGSSAASREGTLAHALAEACLRKGQEPSSYIGKKLTVELDGKIEQPVIEKDMADKVVVYVEHCRTLAMLADAHHVEQEVHATTEVHGKIVRDLLWGTADFIAVSSDRIDVVDLKFGGMPVEAENNPQLVCYLLGAIELLGEDRPNRGAVHIVQPKLGYEPKIWEIEDLEALRAEWLPRLEAAMERALEAAELDEPLDAMHQVGGHCHFCPALVGCQHFARHMIDVTAAELEEIEPAAPPLDIDRYAVLVERWQARGTIKRYFELLEDRLMADIRKGVAVPGLKIVESLGNRKWTLTDGEMISRLRNQGLKKADFIEEKLVGPAKVEKLIDNPRFMRKYVSRSSSERLAPDSDKRPAVNHAAALEVIEAEVIDLDTDDLGMWPSVDLGLEETAKTEDTTGNEEAEEIQL